MQGYLNQNRDYCRAYASLAGAGQMTSREAAKLGDAQGYEDAEKHPLLSGILWGICIVIAFNLPVAWYWRIAAFLAMGTMAGFVRMVLWPMLRHGRSIEDILD
jgi:hypothetical protein